jgi:arylsulfatase A-like enzyme
MAMFASSTRCGRHSRAIVSALDLAPTILEWSGVRYPSGATAAGRRAMLSGSSLLRLLDGDESSWRGTAFASHTFHSLYAYYPSRAVVADVETGGGTRQLRLAHNLAFGLRFPILEDVHDTATWRAIEAAGEAGNDTGWVYAYEEYMRRPEWQLCDVAADPLCTVNLADDATHADAARQLKEALHQWRADTDDPFIACNPAPTGTGAVWSDTHASVCSF